MKSTFNAAQVIVISALIAAALLYYIPVVFHVRPAY